MEDAVKIIIESSEETRVFNHIEEFALSFRTADEKKATSGTLHNDPSQGFMASSIMELSRIYYDRSK